MEEYMIVSMFRKLRRIIIKETEYLKSSSSSCCSIKPSATNIQNKDQIIIKIASQLNSQSGETIGKRNYGNALKILN